MALTVRTNGSGGANIITSSWFNDIRDLLTGTMVDQEVTVKNNLAVVQLGAAPSVAPAGTLATGSTLGIGAYKYVYTYLSADGESTASPVFSITTTTGNQKVNLTAIAVGPTGTTGRNIYRTVVGGTGIIMKLVTTIADNTTTIFADTIADGSLGVFKPGFSDFGGSVVAKDSSGVVRAQISGDGVFYNNINPTVISGGVAGTLELHQWMQGTLKITWIIFNGFRTGGSDQFITLPQAYTKGLSWRLFGGAGFAFIRDGVAITTTVWTGGSSAGAGSTGTTTSSAGDNQGWLLASIDQVRINSGNSSNHDGFLIMEGK